MQLKFKLVMFGFPALVADMAEVELRLKGYPAARADYETLEQCYLFDLQSGETRKIVLENGRYKVGEIKQPWE